MAQLLRGLHQVCLDGGDVASLLLPVAGDIGRARFGGSHAQLEVVSAYREAGRKLEQECQKRERREPEEEQE